MIITLTVVGLVIAGIVCIIIGANNWKYGALHAIGCGLVFGFGFISIIAMACIAIVQIDKDIDYQNYMYEKEMLEYRIENMEDNVVGNEMIYDDVVEFNNELRGIKKYANSPFTNWFFNERVAAIDYIEINNE